MNEPPKRGRFVPDIPGSEVNYRPCLCTLVDVLGFGALVQQSVKSKEARNRIRFVLKKFEENYHSKGISGDRVMSEPAVIVRHFSDLIARIVPLSARTLKNGSTEPVNLFEEILHEGIDLAAAQFSLLEEGILVRGGLTLGELYWEGNQIFGPALVRAYDLERQLAHHPRIVVDSEIIQNLAPKPKTSFFSWDTYFRQDFDGVWFVDYLSYFVAMSAPNIHFDREGYSSHFEDFRAFLIQELSGREAISSRRSKYLWLATYYNSVIELAPKNSGIDWAELRISI